jgi:hypothetical protein
LNLTDILGLVAGLQEFAGAERGELYRQLLISAPRMLGANPHTQASKMADINQSVI